MTGAAARQHEIVSEKTLNKLKVRFRGGATGGTGGGTIPPLLIKVNFVNRLKPMRKFWGIGGVTSPTIFNFCLSQVFFYADRLSKFDFVYSLACPNMQKSDFAILSIEFSLQTFPTLSEVIHFYYVVEMHPESIRQVAKVASPVVA